MLVQSALGILHGLRQILHVPPLEPALQQEPAGLTQNQILPRRELADALQLGERFGFPVRVVKTAEFNNAEYLANPANRCYFCKHELKVPNHV